MTLLRRLAGLGLSLLLIGVLLSPAVAFADPIVGGSGDACSTTGGASCITGAIGAANGGQGSTIKLGTGFGFTTLSQAINTIIAVIFFVAGLIAFFYILLGAFQYLTAGDESAKTDKARKMITNAAIGLILVALVYVIWIIVINLVPGLNSFFTT